MANRIDLANKAELDALRLELRDALNGYAVAPYRVSDGPPTDAPQDGQLPTIDTTNNRLYVRTNGAWRFAELGENGLGLTGEQLATLATVASKADQEDVDEALALKADQDDVTTALATKAPLTIGTDVWLKEHADLDRIIVGTITRNEDGAATSASVIWDDGTAGGYTATALSSEFPGAVDAYTVSYLGTETKTVIQPVVTRNASGAVIDRPELMVS